MRTIGYQSTGAHMKATLNLLMIACALYAGLPAPARAETALPKIIQTPPLRMTGIGDTVAAPGPTPKLAERLTTTPLTFTGIGDTIAAPGAPPKLPATVNTPPLRMTGSEP